MKAISVKQPWASLIVSGLKDVENRTWPTKFRGKILIHASQKPVPGGWKSLNPQQFQKIYTTGISKSKLPYSAIIGCVDIVDCVKGYPSVWAEPEVWNWVLENPVMFKFPIFNVNGKLSIWNFDLPAEYEFEIKVKSSNIINKNG